MTMFDWTGHDYLAARLDRQVNEQGHRLLSDPVLGVIKEDVMEAQ